MIQTTTWHPDTCGCVIEYQWDDTVREETRKHTFSKVTPCGENHPQAVIGQQVEGSDFHKDHISKQKPVVMDDSAPLTPDELKQLRKLLKG